MNDTTNSAADITPITSTTDWRYDHYVGDGYTGYAPTKVGEYVHIHAARGYVQRGLRFTWLDGSAVPTTYQIVEIQPGYDVEVVGGIAHQGTLYVCRDITISHGDFEWTLTVPAIRLVKAAAPATAGR